jgi:4-hydroxyphenylpyruvate dioxygenase-like putative hemolysin
MHFSPNTINIDVPPWCCCWCPAGFHEFAEFVAEDVGTVDSGLNSMVLANNNELVLLPINEPTFGTKRKSQIQVGMESLKTKLLPNSGVICLWILSAKGFLSANGLVVLCHCKPRVVLQPPQTYLEQYEGPGLQHLALKTNNTSATHLQMVLLSAECCLLCRLNVVC